MQFTYQPVEYDAVRHILAAPEITHRTAPYVHEEDFDWGGLREEAATMSGGERVLVDVAYDLWNAKRTIGLWELPRRLDVSHFRRVLEALCLCRTGFGGRLEMRDAGELAA